MARARTDAARIAAARAGAQQTAAPQPAGARGALAARTRAAPSNPARPGEHVEVLSNDPIPGIDDPRTHLKPVLEQTNEVRADAVEPLDDAEADHARRAEAEAPDCEYAVVVKGGKFLDGQGFRATLGEGKEIDSRNYNFATLQRSGIKLRKLKPEERGQFIES